MAVEDGATWIAGHVRQLLLGLKHVYLYTFKHRQQHEICI